MAWLRDIIVRIRGDKTSLDTTLTGAENKIKSFAGKASSAFKGLFAITAIVAFGKALIRASEDLSDKFGKALAGVKGSLNEFFRILASGDFSNFFQNLSEGYAKASKLAEALDLFKDKKAYLEYQISGKKLEASGFEEIVKDATGKYPLELRKQYATKLKDIEIEIRDMTQQIAQETYDFEAKAWENRNHMSVEEAKKLYDAVAGISKEKQDLAFKAFDTYIKRFGKAAFLKSEGVVAGVFKNQSDLLKEYYDLIKTGELDLIPKLYESSRKLLEDKNAAQERYNGVLRITNALLKEIGTFPKTKGPALAPTGNLTFPSFGLPAGTLAGAPITQIDIQTIESLTKGLLDQQEAVNILSASFAQLFSKTGEGFQGMIDTMIEALNRLLAEMVAKAVLWTILNIITGGQAGTFNAFMGFGAATGKGAGIKGATGSIGAGVGKTSMDINVIGSISGKDIALALRRNG